MAVLRHPQTASNARARASEVCRPRYRALSASRLGRLHDAMQRHVDSGRLPGLVTLLYRGGEEHTHTIGTLAFGSKAPMQRDSIFRLASSTKPITSVATMILVEECRLRLDDPVDEFLPELRDRRVLRTIDGPLDDTVPANRSITLRDLLTFRSGYGEVLFTAPGCPLQRALVEARLPLADWLFKDSADEFMKRLGALPLAHQPGERWLYHMSADILGVLIARAAGKSFGSFLRERIFEPLGMKDTAFGVPEDKRDRFTTCYGTNFATGGFEVSDDPHAGLFTQRRAFESGGGGLVSTADDLLAFGRMLLNKGTYGRHRIVSRASVEVMSKDHITPQQKAVSPFFPGYWESRGWGFAMSVTTQRFDVAGGAGRFGWDGAFGTSMYVDPSEDLVGVLMTQRSPDTFAMPAVFADFWTSVYQAIDD